MSLDNLYSISFIIVFSITVNSFLNSFNSEEKVIVKKKRKNMKEDNIKITDILNKKNVKCTSKKKIFKEKFTNYKNNEKAVEIINEKIKKNKKDNNIYFIRPKNQYDDITSEKFYNNNFIYPINPIDNKGILKASNSEGNPNTVDDLDKLKMSNNYYKY